MIKVQLIVICHASISAQTPPSLSPSCLKTNQKPLQQPRLNQARLGLAFFPSWKSHLLNKALLILLSSSFNITQRLWLIFLSSQCTLVLTWDSSLTVPMVFQFSKQFCSWFTLEKPLTFCKSSVLCSKHTNLPGGKKSFCYKDLLQTLKRKCWDFIIVHWPPWMILLLMTYTLHQPNQLTPLFNNGLWCPNKFQGWLSLTQLWGCCREKYWGMQTGPVKLRLQRAHCSCPRKK